ncbi:hypothetical protein ABES96_28640, partial [Bacillus nitratireducens]
KLMDVWRYPMPINLRKQIHPKTKKVNLIIMNKCGVKNGVMGIFRNLSEQSPFSIMKELF